MQNKKTLQFVVDNNLCTGCGTCAGICFYEAIKMELNSKGIIVPYINYELCVGCGLCMKVCPGHEFDYNYYQKSIHGSLPGNIALGHCIDSYSGITKDEKVYNLSQSGGFVSAFLINGIANKKFDGAIVTKWQECNPLRPITYIAENSDEILQAVGSKYNPVPVNSIIKELLNKNGVFAFVGTSCQIQGMRKAEDLCSELKRKIRVYIGLHCYKVFNYHYYAQVLHKINLQVKDVKKFRYRDKSWRGWPGDVFIVKTNNQLVNIDGTMMRIWPKSAFSNWRCQMCFDKLNEFSDISCGDCRMPEQYGENRLSDIHYKHPGQSDIIIRTNRGKELFDNIFTDGAFVFKKSNHENLVKSVRVAEKKLGLKDYYWFTKIFKIAFPNYGVLFERSKNNCTLDILLRPYSALASAHYYLCHILIKYKIFRWLLKRMPHKYLGIIERIRERYVFHVIHGKDHDLKLVSKKQNI